jgi:hypothetical protein
MRLNRSRQRAYMGRNPQTNGQWEWELGPDDQMKRSLRYLGSLEASLLNDSSNRSECRMRLLRPSYCQADADLKERYLWVVSSSSSVGRAQFPSRAAAGQCTRVNIRLRHTRVFGSRYVHLYYYHPSQRPDLFRNRNFLPPMASKQTQQTQTQQQQQLAKQKAAEAEAEKIKEYIAKRAPFPSSAHLPLIDPTLVSVFTILTVIPTTSMNIVTSYCQSPCSK